MTSSFGSIFIDSSKVSPLCRVGNEKIFGYSVVRAWTILCVGVAHLFCLRTNVCGLCAKCVVAGYSVCFRPPVGNKSDRKTERAGFAILHTHVVPTRTVQARRKIGFGALVVLYRVFFSKCVALSSPPVHTPVAKFGTTPINHPSV